MMNAACRMVMLFLAVWSLLLLPLPLGAETGLPLPRFVSVRTTEANVRAGPGLRYEIRWVFKRKGMPLEVIAEFEQWRKVRDIEGDEGWMHRSMLSNKRTVTVMAQEVVTLRSDEEPESRPAFRVEGGVDGELLECEEEFCRIRVEEYKGWIARKYLWGIYSDEQI